MERAEALPSALIIISLDSLYSDYIVFIYDFKIFFWIVFLVCAFEKKLN